MTTTSFRVGVFSGLFPPAFRGGGPIRSVDAMVRTAPARAEIFVITSDRDLGSHNSLSVEPNIWVTWNNASVVYATIASPLRLLHGLWMLRAKRPQLLHFNSFFTPHLTILPLLLARVGFWGRPVLLVAPRGEFGEGALNRNWRKKRIYIALFRVLKLHRSVLWHSTAPHETDAIRELWGANSKIIYRENDTRLPSAALAPRGRESGVLRSAFLGRIVEHKGLHIILEALQSSSVSLVLDIYGASEDMSYEQRCKEVAAKLPPNIAVSFLGVIEPEGVRDVLSDHDVLLMPTAGENFGHVIAEALSASCFVVTTPDTPWTTVLQKGAGIVVKRTPEDWREVIESLARSGTARMHALRRAAGEGYERWAARPRAPHVWELALDRTS